MAYEGDIIRFSWRNRSYFGDSILSPMRNQQTVGTGSCPQHSVGAALEMLTWMKLLREGRGNQKKEIDIEDMYNRYRNYRRSKGREDESSTKQLLLWLKANVSFAKDGSKVFKLEGFEELRPLDKIGTIAKMLQFLFQKGPFVGVFYVKSDFGKVGGNEIYLCNGLFRLYDKGVKRLRHAVVVVGFGIDRNLNPFWEYQESVAPCQTTFDGSGFGRVIITGFDKAYLLHV